jgi:predicted nuclease of restriction endonuclease-like (RecB) superfamily
MFPGSLTMAKKKPTKLPAKANLPKKPLAKASGGTPLLKELQQLIRVTRKQTAQAVNSALVMLHWEIGYRIRTEVLGDKRAGYGNEILATVSQELVAEFGKGYSISNLSRMMSLVECFPDQQIVSTLSAKLGWSHFVEIVPLKDPLQREFYAEMCRIERWSVRALRAKIGGMLFERTALSRKPEELARQELAALKEEDRLTADLVFRDPYILDFLGLKETYSEADLENAILREIERVLLEFGEGFCFVARQKRITVGADDFYLDLLFYHRHLRRLIAVELKLGKWKPSDKGQMELYLRWLEKHDVQPGEDPPLGLILCAGKDDEQVELLQLDRSGIRVATYLTELPSRALLEKRLHDAVRLAESRLQKPV